MSCVLLVCLPALSCRTPPEPPQPPPNLIVLVTDDQRWDAVGYAGNPIIHTPNLDGLAAAGWTFSNAYVTTPICPVSRASLLSGQYARRHGIHGFASGFAPEALAATYPSLLRAAGYRTGFIGKYGVGPDMPAHAFDFWRGIAGQPQYEQTGPNGEPRHLTRILGDQAVEFLESANPEQPFCLSVSFKAPHVQDRDPRQFIYDPLDGPLYQDDSIPVPASATPEAFQNLPDFLRLNSEARIRWQLRFAGPRQFQESVKGYYRLISGIDAVVGQIRDTLQVTGQSENTVILFISDNGFFLGEHGLAGKWYGYEESIRVPLLIHDPRMPQQYRGRVQEEMVLNIDVAPTLLSLAGLPIPHSMQGRDLYRLLGDGADWRKDFLFEHFFEHPRIPRSEGIVSLDHKYLRYVDQDPVAEQLFDLRKDPAERNDVVADPGYQQLATRLRERLAELTARYQ